MDSLVRRVVLYTAEVIAFHNRFIWDMINMSPLGNKTFSWFIVGLIENNKDYNLGC